MRFISTLIEDIFSPNSVTMQDTMALIRNLGVRLPDRGAEARASVDQIESIRLAQDSVTIDQAKLVA